MAVVSPTECQEEARAGGLVWSAWSTWGGLETVLTGGQLETVRSECGALSFVQIFQILSSMVEILA